MYQSVFGLSIQKCSTMASLIFFFLNIGSYYIEQVALELDLPALVYFCVGITSDATERADTAVKASLLDWKNSTWK